MRSFLSSGFGCHHGLSKVHISFDFHGGIIAQMRSHVNVGNVKVSPKSYIL